ncbi:MAG: IS4 family transposase [bacterium]
MWSNEEIKNVKLGDKRLDVRLSKIVEIFTENPTQSIPEACGSAAATKATYRFLANEKVDAKKIITGAIQSTVEKISQEKEVVFAVDTTEIDYSSHQGVSGLGHLGRISSQGIMLHSTLAISTTGNPFGIVEHAAWSRNIATIGKHKFKKNFLFKEKESYRWAESLRQVEKIVPPHIHAIVVADREADIYDLFALDRANNVDLIIRSAHDRLLTESHQKLFAFLASQPAAGTFVIVVPRSGKRKERTATLEVRFSPITLPTPSRGKSEIKKDIPLIAIEVKEISTTDEPILWRLLTTMNDANSLDGAIRYAQLYSKRWLIERFHYTLKSGCKVEDLQLETRDRLMRALAIYTIVACRLLHITYAARTTPDAPCTAFISEAYWKALFCFHNKAMKAPKKPCTIREAVFLIAKLGGFLGRKSDGFPGVKVLWRGLTRLDDIVEIYSVFKGKK